MRGIIDLNDIRNAMQTEAGIVGIAADVAYYKILDRGTLTPAAALNADDHALLAVGVRRANTFLHCSTYVNPRAVEPIIDLIEPYAQANTVGNYPEYTVFTRGNEEPRQAIRLRASGPFDGHAIFDCAKPDVEFFKAQTGGATVFSHRSSPNGKRFTSAEIEEGVTLYASPDVDMSHLTLKLGSNTCLVAAQPARANLKYAAGALMLFTPSPSIRQRMPQHSQAER
jgi:hypothetical protein